MLNNKTRNNQAYNEYIFELYFANSIEQMLFSLKSKKDSKFK